MVIYIDYEFDMSKQIISQVIQVTGKDEELIREVKRKIFLISNAGLKIIQRKYQTVLLKENFHIISFLSSVMCYLCDDLLNTEEFYDFYPQIKEISVEDILKDFKTLAEEYDELTLLIYRFEEKMRDNLTIKKIKKLPRVPGAIPIFEENEIEIIN